MRLTLVVFTTRVPVGGVTTRYELANGMARRGHEVHLLHFCLPDLPDEVLRAYAFEPSIRHHRISGLPDDRYPEADIVLSPSLPPACGWPAQLFQSIGLFDKEFQAEAVRTPGPIICTSRWLVKHARRNGVPDKRLARVPVGIDHGVFRVVRPIADRPRRVAMLTHGLPSKGTGLGFAALEAVRARVPDLQIVLYGTRLPDHEMPVGADFFQLPDRETLVERVYNDSSVFLCPSLREGFGKPSVEAMASGCALVTFNNGGSEDFAIDGETALVCRRRDVDALAAAVTRLLLDDALRIDIETRGNEFVQRFDWEHSAALLEVVLNRYRRNPDVFGLAFTPSGEPVRGVTGP
ncbi:MAG: glycosyltransferase family 4 protein [Acidimicrobiales bacterium]|jgi:glycosyltransferase involved in cell wall biosynthesis|nr:glycosyltransferase family 4 protein [Acidimicrobiales bacterium]